MTNEYARASGHSIIGLAVFDRSALHAEPHRQLLIAGPPAGVAGRLEVFCQVDPSTHSLGIGI